MFLQQGGDFLGGNRKAFGCGDAGADDRVVKLV